MTNPRRPDDARLSTADLAQAGERSAEQRAAEQRTSAQRAAEQRTIEQQRAAEQRAADQRDANLQPRPGQPAPSATPSAHAAARQQPADRDVTAAQHANVVADATAARRASAQDERPNPLFAGQESEEFRHRWQDIQTGFVDEPRQALERADALVAETMKRLAEIFAHERGTLEQQWSRGGDVSTEDLRVALRRYRGFFDRLLSV